MQFSDLPAFFAKRFGADATGTHIRAVPATTADPNAASMALGFPPNTFVDVSAGGSPPDGRDFNGILNYLSAWAQWQSVGGAIQWSSTISAAIGGYPLGATVLSATDLGSYWLCTVNNNTSNPDTGGAGWRRLAMAGGLIAVRQFTTNGTYTPSAGTRSIEVTAVGGGGAGGGTVAMGGGSFGAGGGGASGFWNTNVFTSGFASVPITIGNGGTAAPGAIGGTGGTTTFGGLVGAGGGLGGAAGAAVAGGSCQVGGAGGAPGGPGVAFANTNQLSGFGGSTPFGTGGASRNTTSSVGNAGAGPGGGGSGAVGQSGAAALPGGNGAPGIVIVKEYA